MKYLLLLVFLIFISGALFSQSSNPNFQYAESLFRHNDWIHSIPAFEKSIQQNSKENIDPIIYYHLGVAYFHLHNNEKALKYLSKANALNPRRALGAEILMEIAKVYGSQNKRMQVLDYLNQLIKTGFFNYYNIVQAQEFTKFKKDSGFISLEKEAYALAFPCMVNPHDREFDFWVGEWNAYDFKSHLLRGHSIIQIASGGCMILENWTSLITNYSGKSINFVDTTSHKWKQVWVGAEGPVAMCFIMVYT